MVSRPGTRALDEHVDLLDAVCSIALRAADSAANEAARRGLTGALEADIATDARAAQRQTPRRRISVHANDVLLKVDLM